MHAWRLIASGQKPALVLALLRIVERLLSKELMLTLARERAREAVRGIQAVICRLGQQVEAESG